MSLAQTDVTQGQLRFRGEADGMQMNGPLPPAFRQDSIPAEFDFSATPSAMRGDIQEIQFNEITSEVPDATAEADPTADTGNLASSESDSTSIEHLSSDNLAVHSADDFSIYSEQQQPLLYSTNQAFRRGHYYASADIVMMLKSQVENVLVAVDAADGARLLFRRSLDTTDAGLSYESGSRITIGRFLGQDVANRDVVFEFSFLGGFDYFASANIVGSLIGDGNNNAIPSLLSAIDTSDPVQVILPNRALPSTFDVNQAFNFVREQTINYSSDFHSAEFNFKILGRPLRDRVALQPNGSWVRHASSNRIKSGLLGFRYVTVNDYFDLQSDVGDAVGSNGNYSVNTHNNMFGIQVGGNFEELYSNWSWGMQFKTAGLLNFLDRDSVLETTLANNFSSTAESLSDEHLAIMVEAGARASYRIKPNIIVRTSYDFLYLTGIATAPPNLGLQFPKFEVNGDTFMHGISFGVEMLW